MQNNINPLFQPFKLKSLELKNRIVMAPMTRAFSPDGIPGEDVADYYRRRAANDVGLILSEGTVINRPASTNEKSIPHFYGQSALAGWKNVIDGVHKVGGKMGPQIWHVGSVANALTDWEPKGVESPSGLVALDSKRGQKMSDEDIQDTTLAFAKAAREAKSLGFDVAELHGAHGYLIDQFFWAITNKRTDQYGGLTIEQRNRFAVEIIQSVRQEVGSEFPIIMRVSQWKQQDYNARIAHSPKEMEQWLVPLVEAGVDILHCSQRRFWEPEFSDIDGDNGLNFAGWAKKLTGAATITVGSVGLSNDFLSAFEGNSSTASSMDHLISRLDAGEFDLVAVGRSLLSDPSWINKVKTGERLKGFNPADLGKLT